MALYGMIGRVRNWTRRVVRKLTGAAEPTPIEIYRAGKRVPWTTGYAEFKEEFVHHVVGDEALLAVFRKNGALPAGYGYRLDERVVEYPWLWSRLTEAPARLMDAGGILIYANLLKLPLFDKKWLLIYTLEDNQGRPAHDKGARICGDLRHTALADEVFDEVVCVSTLEHIGLDNTRLYTSDERFREARPDDYLLAIHEFRRVLVPGGRLLLTVPYGRYHNHGWLQQFDRALVETTVRAFDGDLIDEAYYKYEPTGWRSALEPECREAVYFDGHATPKFSGDYAAGARAVACLALRKPGAGAAGDASRFIPAASNVT